MRAESIVRQIGKGCRDQIHPARFRAFTEVVEAASRSKRLTLTALGRAVRCTALVRHRIKKVDRLLGNPKLRKERLLWFKALVARLARGQRRLVVLVDWTQIRGEFWALVASVPFGGRSIPILAQAYTHDQLGAQEAHLAFLHDLRQVVQRDCRAVIVADGGFRSPFFRACEAVGMDFVIRLRNQKSVAMFEWGVRIKFAKLFESATALAQCLGDGRPYVSSESSGYIRLVLGPKPEKSHLRKKYKDDYERARATEPWLLATSLENDAAQTIVKIYAQRMKIEEAFRDAKCPRFGWALKYSGSKPSLSEISCKRAV